jgi:hypothetical protein
MVNRPRPDYGPVKAYMHPAGMYVPYIADGMLNQSDTAYFNVSGIMVYDTSIGWDSVAQQAPVVAYTEANANVYVHCSYNRPTDVLT